MLNNVTPQPEILAQCGPLCGLPPAVPEKRVRYNEVSAEGSGFFKEQIIIDTNLTIF